MRHSGSHSGREFKERIKRKAIGEATGERGRSESKDQDSSSIQLLRSRKIWESYLNPLNYRLLICKVRAIKPSTLGCWED